MNLSQEQSEALYLAALAVSNEVYETLGPRLTLETISDEEVIEVSVPLLRDICAALVTP